MKHRIYIKDWTEYPGTRFRSEGAGSAQEFRDEHLAPLLQHCGGRIRRLSVHLDGCAGFSHSFLEELFGGIRRMHPALYGLIDIVYDEDPDTAEIARSFLKGAPPEDTRDWCWARDKDDVHGVFASREGAILDAKTWHERGDVLVGRCEELAIPEFDLDYLEELIEEKLCELHNLDEACVYIGPRDAAERDLKAWLAKYAEVSAPAYIMADVETVELS